jgi:porin
MKPCLIIAAVSVAIPLPIHASWLEGDYLTGDWKGERTRLKESGVTFFGYYNAIGAANVSGGIESDSSYAGDLFVGAKFDLEKLLGWDSTIFTLSGIDRHGRSIDPAVGGQYSVMQLVGGQNAFLYEVNIEKKFLDDTLSVKLGRLSATDDFVGSPYYSYSLNNAVNGQIRAVLFDGVMTSYPFAVWGGRVKYQPSEEFYFSVGAYQLSDDIFDRDDQGVDFRIDGDDGLSIFTQLGWSPKLAERPANFFVGMNNAFDRMERFNTNETSNHFVRFYAHGDYQFHAEGPDSKEGLVGFATLAYTTQEDIAIIPFQTTLGLHYKGLFPGRNDDSTVFFATFGKFSDDYAAERIAAGAGDPDYELVLEFGHRFEVTEFAYLQPDLQYIIRPGGTGRTDNALVLGAQFGFTF